MGKDVIYPSFSVEEEKTGQPPKYDSSESLPRTLDPSDLVGPKAWMDTSSSNDENPHADGYFDANGEYIRSHGLNWIITGLFVVGDLAGGGLVALPTAMIQSGNIYLNLIEAQCLLD
jgi:hypothetical protein